MVNSVQLSPQVARQQQRAQQRLLVFEQRYGAAALEFACYAAFPLTLTTDLSYCLRQRFTPTLPWYVAADVLLSGLCQSVGYDLYEMTTATRHLLLERLVQQRGNGELKQVVKFMAAYIHYRLELEGDRRAKGLGYPPEWIAMAYLDFKGDAAIAQKICQQLQALLQDGDPKERFRLAALVENQADLLVQQGIQPVTLQALVQQLEAGEPIEEQSEEQELTRLEFEIVKVDRRGQIIDRQTQTAFQFIEPLENQTKLEMVAIPSGEFQMGSPKDEPGRLVGSESPQHWVTVAPFFLGKYPITQAQWRFVASLPEVKRSLRSDPSRFKGKAHPVERVSWHDAVEFCDRLSRYTGREYRLPTEAEWEYACRAGTTTPFYFGQTITGELANYHASSTYADEPEGKVRSQTTPVGNFPPNAFGLYDMHGNVREWCQDHWHKNYQDAPIDGSAWIDPNVEENVARVMRGGSWIHIPGDCRSAFRLRIDLDSRRNGLGFRVVCSLPRTL